MGSGSHTYEVAQGWDKLPEGFKYGFTHGVVTDKQDNVYIFNTGANNVLKFDRDGRFLSTWGTRFEGAHGFYLHKEADGEYLYLTDTKLGIAVKTTLDGQELLELGTPDLPDVYDGEKKLFKPTDVAVAPNGDIYVADGYGQHYIHQYTVKGEYIRSWGGKGSEPGQLACPHGVSVDLRSGEPELYVADRANHRFQVFTLEGVHKRFVTGDMDMPCNFYYFGDEIYFPDLHSRVTIFDKNDRLIVHLGEDSEAWKQQGWPNLPESFFRADKFSSPHGICVDSHGDIYLVEWINRGRVTKLVRK
jgi:hypothetical protein